MNQEAGQSFTIGSHRSGKYDERRPDLGKVLPEITRDSYPSRGRRVPVVASCSAILKVGN
ncbi:hypothetical protein IMZ48_16930 [Candidatus Bathyarchaeota archaeon]|nr:hypothetical protein [Candidatus Bathyarchaeota archaeon]